MVHSLEHGSRLCPCHPQESNHDLPSSESISHGTKTFGSWHIKRSLIHLTQVVRAMHWWCKCRIIAKRSPRSFWSVPFWSLSSVTLSCVDKSNAVLRWSIGKSCEPRMQRKLQTFQPFLGNRFAVKSNQFFENTVLRSLEFGVVDLCGSQNHGTSALYPQFRSEILLGSHPQTSELTLSCESRS